MGRYQNVAIRKDLLEKVKIIVEKSSLGYRSVTEFVNDTVRRRVEEFKPLFDEIEKFSRGVKNG